MGGFLTNSPANWSLLIGVSRIALARGTLVSDGSTTTMVPTNGGDFCESMAGITAITPNISTGMATAPKMKPLVSAV